MEKTKKNTVLLLFILFLGYTIVYVDKFFIGIAVVPIAAKLNLDPTKMGIVMSAFFLGYAAMQIPAGILNDKIGSKKILIAAQALLGVFAMAFGFGWSIMALMAIRLCAGIVHAGYPVSCSKTVAITYPVEKRTFPQAILIASSGLGGIIAALGGAYLIKTLGYTTTYVGLGMLAVSVSCLIYFLVPQQEMQQSAGNAGNAEKVSLIEVVKNPVVFVLIIAMLGINMDLYGITSWLPSYLVKEKGLDLMTAGKIAAISQLGGGLASVFTGWFVGKYMHNRETGVIVVAGAISAVCLYFIYGAQTLTTATILLFFAYTFLVVTFVTMFTLPLKRVPQKYIGTAMGAVNTGGTLGGFFSPIIIGKLVASSNGAFGTTFVFLAIVAVVSGLMVILIPAAKSKKQEVENVA